MIDLEKKYLDVLDMILKDKLKNLGVKVYFFGSRIKNIARKFSDVDVALKRDKGVIPSEIMDELVLAFEDSNLPYRVDVVDLNNISSEFKAKIEPELVEFKKIP